MSAHQSTSWYWSDWAGDQGVRNLTPAERGLWIDLLTLAAVGKPTGYVCDAKGDPVPLEQIARFANCSTAEASNLISGILAKGVASQDRSGRLFNRRIVRDAERSEKKRRAGMLGGTATALKFFSKNGVPQHLPQHVPRHPGMRLSKKSKITTTETAAARETARPAAVSPELSEVMQKRGWVNGSGT